ncbi:hypothetical protein H4R34_002333 [Dimargaris verticillata]|uniref:FAD-binding FR-type domain-containing protein n=1 Tax=Dimargaris verticillata TaxID=2761393 RepID=A0A9W8B8B3_9FUNG|nr:hypothetical protein H4R34_002333 [Dimargaris verticillata]
MPPIPKSPLVRVISAAGQAMLVTGGLGYAYYGWYLPVRDPRRVPNQLDPHYFRHFTVVDRQPLTHDTVLLRFQDTNPASPLDTNGILSVDVKDPAIQVKRSFTPIPSAFIADPRSGNTYQGSPAATDFALLVKRYPLASVASLLHRIPVGGTAELRGPYVQWLYDANRWSALGMVAGGTGITPMLQLIHRVLANPHDQTRLSLVLANRTEQDIPLLSQLEALQRQYPEQLSIQLTIDGWSQPDAAEHFITTLPLAVGPISRGLLQQRLPSANASPIILVSGPDGMMRAICGERLANMEQGPLQGILQELGYDSSHVFKL